MTLVDPTAAAARGAESANRGRLARYREVRAATLALIQGLSAEDMQPQSMPDASPTKWHLAHTTWFFETFLLLRRPEAEPFDASFTRLFNSYYETLGAPAPRAMRGLITRPSVEAVLAYRAWVDAGMERLIAAGLDETEAALLELGFSHEQQHQELILTDGLHLLSCNPLHPAFTGQAAPAPAAPARLTWTERPGGVVSVGAEADGFAFDNERPRHPTLLAAHAIADRLVTNAEWRDFMEEGGYRRPELWLSDGWARVVAEGWEAPLYWARDPADGWRVYDLHGLHALDPHSPVAHLSLYEADAYARWADARLPTEFEWEAYAAGHPASAAAALAPRPATPEGGPEQFYDALWQWTSSAYAAYPGFVAEAGAVGEYNGKFMSGQMVLRGGSFATAPGHSRASYRNFFPPGARWQFSGLRLARDRVAAAPASADMREDVLQGLRAPRKRLSSKHLYDAAGSHLFEEITQLAAYYPTRTEAALLTAAAPQIAERIAEAGAAEGVLVEFGSGASVKTRLLLDALPQLRAYAPLDISRAALDGAAKALRRDYALAITPIETDFTQPARLPAVHDGAPRIGFFPGSTIGNFTPQAAQTFLEGARETLGAGALFLVGVDLVKPEAVLLRAYDDEEGVTAAFNLNLLTRMNRELGADFDLSAFRHRAVWNAAESRMEMRLVSQRRQDVHIGADTIRFVEGESIHTENSYKYTPAGFAALARRAGWGVLQSWTSPAPFSFGVWLLRR